MNRKAVFTAVATVVVPVGLAILAATFGVWAFRRLLEDLREKREERSLLRLAVEDGVPRAEARRELRFVKKT